MWQRRVILAAVVGSVLMSAPCLADRIMRSSDGNAGQRLPTASTSLADVINSQEQLAELSQLLQWHMEVREHSLGDTERRASAANCILERVCPSGKAKQPSTL